ncbi:MAG: nucleotidyltransferase domain-containing protein [Clostridia bacterium]|nr:nucleotidyltransferase domain-containing protein [Clostridia bacterium]
MRETIVKMLRNIERQHHIRILYAVESGSRAWGFASADSDYDVRYIYIRPAEDYLRVDPLRDTIEGPLDDVMDFSGWDLRKALFLLRKTNPSLMEWAQSPIVYITTPQWERLYAQFGGYFSPLSNMHHYMSMVKSHWLKYIQGDQVKLKRYLYVLRPLLCCRWLLRYGTVPPVPFDRLCQAVLPQEMEAAVQDLLRRKKAAGEAELADHIPELDAFILQEIPQINQAISAMESAEPPGYEGLNRMFLEALRETRWDT